MTYIFQCAPLLHLGFGRLANVRFFVCDVISNFTTIQWAPLIRLVLVDPGVYLNVMRQIEMSQHVVVSFLHVSLAFHQKIKKSSISTHSRIYQI